MALTAFDHYTLRCQNVDVSAAFYVDVLGLRAQTLDGFAFPMRLLFLGEQAIVHLMGVGAGLDAFLGRSAPCYGTAAERRTGNLEHVAFNASGLKELSTRLEQAGVAYVERILADYGVAQLMFEDPDGVEIEVNFPLAEKLS